jgi:predicted  nucleic acid-binding Zn-ribbon protein
VNPGNLGVMIPIIGLLIGGFVVFAKSEIGRALAHRIAGGASAASGLEAELHALRGEVEALRAELLETQERLDFTERVLAGAKKDG